MRALALLLAVLCLAPAVASLPLSLPVPIGLPPQGPDVPALTAPVAVVTTHDRVVFSFTEGGSALPLAVPSMPWNRVVLEFTGTPIGDPWDRLFSVSIGSVEVLRGTSPRTEFTVKSDITEYASLLRPGSLVPIHVLFSTYVGAQQATVRFAFYDDPTGLAMDRADNVLGALRWQYLGGNGDRRVAAVAFPVAAPSSAIVELTLTGHGNEEFWFGSFFLTQPQNLPRTFHIRVDGIEVAQVKALPYTYAFLGFAQGNGQMGPTQQLIHTAMWWTAQQGLDVAGVHAGVGQIPAYRAQVNPEHLALLQGARSVEVQQENGRGFWVTSLSFLLDA